MSKQLFLEQNLQEGEIYAGLILGKNGERDYHLVLLAAKPDKDLNWQAAMVWAKSVGGYVPDRREARLLFINSSDSFDEDTWYWTSTTHADYSDFAWMQHFSDGDQTSYRKSNEYSARAVRRIYIEE